MQEDRARQQPRRDRTANERAADHAAIDRLADDLLPALVAKLSATGLGEIEVREGPWRVQPGHAGHGHSPAGFEGHRSARQAPEGRPTGHSTNGSSPALTAVGPGPEPASGGDGSRGAER